MANNEALIIDLTSDDESSDNNNPPPKPPTADLDGNPLPQEPTADDDDNPLPQGPVADSNSDSDDNSQPRGAVYKLWTFHDEKLMLTTLADERRRTGKRPPTQDLFNAVRGKLRRENAQVPDVSNKISNLKSLFKEANEKGGPGKKERHKRLFELSKPVWPELLLVHNAPVVIEID